MADVILTRGEDGKLHGLTDVDERAWVKFRAAIERLVVGDTLRAVFKLPRSPGFHRRHFAIMKGLFECQEQFDTLKRLRLWLQVGAGFCDLLPGPHGRPVAIPQSIAWERLEEADFAEHHAEVIKFMRTSACTGFLWPHLSAQKQSEMIEAILQEFDA